MKILRKLLCYLGFHKEGFIGNENERGWGCECCGKYLTQSK